MKPRWFSALSRGIPVVSSSSPPESHGVGSSSSVMWTQRISRSDAASFAAAVFRPSSDVRLSTVSTGPLASHPAGRLFENRPEHVDDLLELLGVRDQWRRQLDHRVAAVIGTADQPPAVQLPGEVAAEQRLRLLAVERLLGFLVLDQLDRQEVSVATHVADDRDVV